MGFGQYSQAGSFERRNPLAEVEKPKRQRQVFPTNEIPHLWAHQTQASARNAQGNFYFDGAVIYSYGDHFPIAEHVTNTRGNKAVLVTTREYSVTTSGHIHAVRCGIPKDVQVFHVELRGTNELPHSSHMDNYRAELTRQIAALEKTHSLRKYMWRERDAQAQRAEIIAYGKFFRVKIGKLPQVPALDATKRAKLLAFDVAQAERNKRKRERDKQRWAEYERINALSQAERITEWRAGKNVSVWHVPTMLRIEGAELVTSRGARVPIEHARRALRFIRVVMARGTEYQRNGHTEHVGNYTIDRVTPDGTLYAGCHVITWDEIQRIAPALES